MHTQIIYTGNDTIQASSGSKPGSSTKCVAYVKQLEFPGFSFCICKTRGEGGGESEHEDSQSAFELSQCNRNSKNQRQVCKKH